MNKLQGFFLRVNIFFLKENYKASYTKIKVQNSKNKKRDNFFEKNEKRDIFSSKAIQSMLLPSKSNISRDGIRHPTRETKSSIVEEFALHESKKIS